MMHKSPSKQAAAAPPTALQRQVVGGIVELVRRQALPAGSVLSELSVARDLGVSRTPARAALAWLAAQGLLQRRPGEGFATAQPAERFEAPALDLPVAEADRLFVEIARERNAGRLPTDVSEADLMRRFEVTRPTLLRVLNRLGEVGMVARRTGHGWHFLANDNDRAAQRESYRFRLIIEPAALLEPGFAPVPGWLADMRARHQAMLRRPWTTADAIDLFEMNAEFHEGLAAASGNRFLRMAMQQQNRLRRFVNYDWNYGRERMVVSCTEHLEIIARLVDGDRDVAAALLRRHLEMAAPKGAPAAATAGRG